MTQPAGSGSGVQQAAARERLKRPAVACTYGHSKTGKTTDALFSFPMALFIAEPAALKSALDVVGWAPQAVEPVTDLDGVAAAIKKHLRGKTQHDALVIDDLSVAANHSRTKLDGRYSGWDLWRKLGTQIARILIDCREVDVHVVFTCHMRTPGTAGNPPGGPDMPTERLSLELPKACDAVLRAEYNPVRQPHPACYRGTLASGGGAWIAGDRHGICTDDTPMNLAEILRAAGFIIRRPQGYEWMEQVITVAAQQMLQAGPAHDTTILADYGRKIVTHLQPGWQTGHPLRPDVDKILAWVWRDLRDRVEITRNRATRSAAFGIPL